MLGPAQARLWTQGGRRPIPPVPCVPWDQSPLTWPGFVFRLELPLAGEAMLVKK